MHGAHPTPAGAAFPVERPYTTPSTRSSVQDWHCAIACMSVVPAVAGRDNSRECTSHPASPGLAE